MTPEHMIRTEDPSVIGPALKDRTVTHVETYDGYMVLWLDNDARLYVDAPALYTPETAKPKSTLGFVPSDVSQFEGDWS